MNEVIWSDIELPNYGTICISNDGRVYSYKAKKELYRRTNTDGYLCIRIKELNYSDREYKIHRLVAMAFIPNPENKPEVNHINSNRKNNRVENLEWVTKSENMKHGFAYGNKSVVGKQNPRAILCDDDIREIRRMHEGGATVSDIARVYGRGWQTINHVVKRTTWAHVV